MSQSDLRKKYNLDDNKNKESNDKSIDENLVLDNTEVKITDFSNDKKILDKTFNYSLSYDVQDQISDTKKQENKSIDNLLNKTYQELLILLTKNII